jgi:hypothetical protein
LSSGAPPVRSSVPIAAQHVEYLVDVYIHHSFALGPVDVAMEARLIAAVAEVDLQRVIVAGRERGLFQRRHGVHRGPQ